MKYQPAQSRDVFHWPEFKAFIKRLGVQWETPIRDIAIIMSMDELVTIYTDTQGLDTTRAISKIPSPIQSLQDSLDYAEADRHGNPIPGGPVQIDKKAAALVEITYQLDTKFWVEKEYLTASSGEDAEAKVRSRLMSSKLADGVICRSIRFKEWT